MERRHRLFSMPVFSAKNMKWEKMTYVLSKIALSSLGKVAYHSIVRSVRKQPFFMRCRILRFPEGYISENIFRNKERFVIMYINIMRMRKQGSSVYNCRKIT